MLHNSPTCIRWVRAKPIVAMSSKLIVIGGLPGTGKTSLATGLARTLDAVHLRIDTIEQALRISAIGGDVIGAAGYVVAHGIAEDNLRLGRIVIVDCVNPLASTRAAWRVVGKRAGVAVFEVEVICSDANLHRQRVESRASVGVLSRVLNGARVRIVDGRTHSDRYRAPASGRRGRQAPCAPARVRALTVFGRANCASALWSIDDVSGRPTSAVTAADAVYAHAPEHGVFTGTTRDRWLQTETLHRQQREYF